MKTTKKQGGFSLMEVNVAIFVMAIGILGLVALYPLGLRESTQGQADLKQSMLADYLLNQAVAAASSTNVTWTEWTAWANNYRPSEGDAMTLNASSVPDFVKKYLKNNKPDWNKAPDEENQYRIRCCLVPGFSDRIMGILVMSTDLESVREYSQYSNNPVYYAEAMFQGDSKR